MGHDHTAMDPADSDRRAGDLARRIRQLQEAAGRNPGDPGILNDLGNALVKARRPREGVNVLRRALEFAPGSSRLYSNLGLGLCDLSQFDAALAALLEAVEREPDWATAHNNLAHLYVVMGRHEEAITCADVALLLRPSY